MIKQESIEALKAIINIADIVASKVELKPQSGGFVGLCPFHTEKTPSFFVTPSKNMFKCFGCGVSGDAIAFLMELDKLSFVEAIEHLADFYNFALEYDKSGRNHDVSAQSVLEDIARFYESRLDSEPKALEYLTRRGISKASIKDFQIGYCGASFETLNHIKSRNLDLNAAREFGVVGVSEGGREYARFSERIIFPIRNPAGKVVGFGGRTMKEDDKTAKYLNSPQSAIFNKSRLLYGFHRAKDAIFKNREIIVCEGYLDVIMLHAAGFTNAVATLGTALTAEHLPLLKKGEPRIIVSFDGDKAGIAAAFKAAKLLAAFDGGVVIFENGKDPADMVFEAMKTRQEARNQNADSKIINQNADSRIQHANQNINPNMNPNTDSRIPNANPNINPNPNRPFDSKNTPKNLEPNFSALKEKFAAPTPFIKFVFTQILKNYNLGDPIQKDRAFSECMGFLRTLSPVLQNEYKSFLARQINLPEHLISTDSKPPKTKNFAFPSVFGPDLNELVLLKTLLCSPALIDVAVEFINDGALIHHASAYERLLKEPIEQARISLSHIYMNENIKPLRDAEALKEQLRLIFITAYTQVVSRLSVAALDINEKVRRMGLVRAHLDQLNQGELTPYVSISTI